MATDAGGDRAPKLIAFPTMTIEALLASSEARIMPPPSGEMAYLQPDGPHTWVLRAGEKDIAFPPGRFTSIETSQGRVVRIQSNPQMAYLGPAQAVARMAEVREQLTLAGFLEADTSPDDKLEREIRQSGGVRACRFRAAEWLGEVRAERAIEAGSEVGRALELTEDACLVKIMIWDIRSAAALIG